MGFFGVQLNKRLKNMDIYPTKDVYRSKLKQLLGFDDVASVRKAFPQLLALPASRTDFWKKALRYAQEAENPSG